MMEFDWPERRLNVQTDGKGTQDGRRGMQSFHENGLDSPKTCCM